MKPSVDKSRDPDEQDSKSTYLPSLISFPPMSILSETNANHVIHLNYRARILVFQRSGYLIKCSLSPPHTLPR